MILSLLFSSQDLPGIIKSSYSSLENVGNGMDFLENGNRADPRHAVMSGQFLALLIRIYIGRRT